MSLPQDLMGLGMAPALAERVGNVLGPVTLGNGTTNATTAVISSTMTQVTPSAGNTAFIVSTSLAINKVRYIMNPTAVAGVLFPPIGGSINGGTANASFTIPANSTVLFFSTKQSSPAVIWAK